MKQCKRCEQWKLFGAFHMDRGEPRLVCRACVAEQNQKRLREDKEYRERRNQAKRRHAAEHREEQRARARAWYQRNRDKVLAKARLRTADERRPSRQRYYAKHRERIVAQACEVVHRRRQLKANGAGLTAADWRAILAKHNNCCAYCGSAGKLTRDHVVPLSRGGLHQPDNIVPACKSCNSGKNNRLPGEWWREAANDAQP